MVVKPRGTHLGVPLAPSTLIRSPILATKELVTNAIDSGARNIYIDIDSRTGGYDYLRVRDDGSGIKVQNRDLICLNRSTSMATCLKEASSADTLRFEGHTLFSLDSLANFKGSIEIITRCKMDRTGEKWFVVQDGSTKGAKKTKTVRMPGTTVVIKKISRQLQPQVFETSIEPLEPIEEFKTLVDHYSLICRFIRFHLCLVTLDNSESLVQRELKKSHDTRLSKLELLSLIAHLRRPVLLNFLTKEHMTIDKDTNADVILPRMSLESEIAKVKNPKKFLSVNGRPHSLESSFGRNVDTMITATYLRLQLPSPTIWYISITCNMEILDANMEARKDTTEMKTFKSLLNILKQQLFLCISEGSDLSESMVEGLKMATGRALLKNKPIKPVLDLANNWEKAQPLEKDHWLHGRAKKKMLMNLSEESLCQKIGNSQTVRGSSRPLTTGSMVSDEGEWTHTFLDEDDLDDTILPVNTDLSSSLTYNYEEISFENEDLELSREVSISNPFMTTKLRKASNQNNSLCVGTGRKNSSFRAGSQQADFKHKKGTIKEDVSQGELGDVDQRSLDDASGTNQAKKIRKIVRKNE